MIRASDGKAEDVESNFWVKVRGLNPGKETLLNFVPDHEADVRHHRLPLASLLGGALATAEIGETIEMPDAHDSRSLTIVDRGPVPP